MISERLCLPMPEGKRSGFVYFVMASDGHCKIGKSKDPEKRVRQMQTGNGLTMPLLHKVASNDACWLERKFHKHFKDKKVRGEWFALTEAEVGAVLGMRQCDRLKVKKVACVDAATAQPRVKDVNAQGLGRKGGEERLAQEGRTGT